MNHTMNKVRTCLMSVLTLVVCTGSGIGAPPAGHTNTSDPAAPLTRLTRPASDAWRVPRRKARKENPFAQMAKDATSLELGKKLYVRECLICHGTTGDGDGKSVEELDKDPLAFKDPLVSGQTDGALFWKISTGRKPMPGYRQMLKEDELWHVVNYVRKLCGPEGPAQPELAAPEVHRKALSGVITPYLAVHAVLSVGDTAFDPSVETLLERATALEKTPQEGLDSRALERWQQAARDLGSAAASLNAAPDLESRRTAFLQVSKHLVGAVKTFGHAEERPLRLFGHTEGDQQVVWLQSGDDPRNPYFGARLLDAGKLEAELAATRTSTDGR